ncbi:DsbA family protein [Rhodalgimonas zhirmunskyi]|uniref:DsbA family protein n=1 Tax=Rhodalgimonas zhirmunskyi TaxID=2964767 RepID=A0AAJ1U9R4_9RHOB|nr:DsbA family protein [Rhodoalgimonas zhirmunskyi]MDQ2094410.1 DsbA family protein [Rhodoalgimonas zhirmunskyi]
MNLTRSFALVLALGLAPAAFAEQHSTEQTTDQATEQAKAPAVVEMTLGAPDAAVEIVEYASFTCSHCAAFHGDQFKKLKAEFIDTGKVHFTYRDVYFDRVGLWASMLARCETPRFFGVSDLIYSKQRDWLSGNDPVLLAENLRKLGKVAGLSEEKIDACMQDGDKAKALVDWFEANAKADDIDSTPSLIINGTKYSNMAYPKLKEIIEKELGN